MQYLRNISLCVLAVWITGCTPKTTTRPAEMQTISWKLPGMAPLAQTKPSQEKGGLMLTLAPPIYTVIRDSEVVETPADPPLFNLTNNIYFYRTTIPIRKVEPARLQFTLTVNNKLDRVFRGAGAVVSMNINNKTIAFSQSGYKGLLDLIVIPRGESQVAIEGPPLEDLPDSCTFALFIYDVVTEVDPAGNPTKKENYEWYYAFNKKAEAETLPINKKYMSRPAGK